jgi:site-specific DNA-adenine methylase
MVTRERKLIAFGWYGGKYSHLDWLLPLLPQTRHFCEPYGGSAAVLINRKPSEIETYNDLYMDYECMLYDLDECNSWYNFIIDSVKEELAEIKLFDIKSSEESNEIEAFDNKTHELLITQDSETKKWKFIYIRKEDHDKFVNFVEYYRLQKDS